MVLVIAIAMASARDNPLSALCAALCAAVAPPPAFCLGAGDVALVICTGQRNFLVAIRVFVDFFDCLLRHIPFFEVTVFVVSEDIICLCFLVGLFVDLKPRRS